MVLSPHWRDPMQYVFATSYYVTKITTALMRYGGIAFVMLGMTLILTIGSIFSYVIIPLVSEGIIQILVHIMITAILLFNIYFNYALCISSDPGFVVRKRTSSILPEDILVEEEKDEDSSEDDSLLSRNRRGTSLTTENESSLKTDRSRRVDFRIQVPPANQVQERSMRASYCKKCRMNRPLRAHHCSVCDRCVDHMDHHCPWVNNCIGLENYRYFFCFLIWLAVGCWYATLVSFSPAYRGLTELQYQKLIALFENGLIRRINIAPKLYLQFTCCISLSAGLAVTILAGWHAYLVFTAQTSVEFQINLSSRNRILNGRRVTSPYSRGSSHANWELVFGKCDYKILSIFPSTRPPPNQRKGNTTPVVPPPISAEDIDIGNAVV